MARTNWQCSICGRYVTLEDDDAVTPLVADGDQHRHGRWRAVLMLASLAAATVAGHILPVDGGFLAQ